MCAIGYAEGGLLSRTLGSWQTISWGLVLASPLMIVLTGVAVAQHPPSGTAAEWGAFAYLCAVSMFLGFFAWYRGLAIGPMAQVSQVQLSQPVMSILWAGSCWGRSSGGRPSRAAPSSLPAHCWRSGRGTAGRRSEAGAPGAENGAAVR